MRARLSAEGWQSAFGSKTPKTHVIMFSLDWIVVRGPLQIGEGTRQPGLGSLADFGDGFDRGREVKHAHHPACSSRTRQGGGN
jgi:hypothetical protein